jgi:NADH-quinone oxidoreductase subunit M
MDQMLTLSLLLVPLIGAIIGSVLKGGSAPRNWALLVSLVTAGIAAVMVGQFDFSNSAAIQMVVSPASFRLDDAGFSFTLGIDSISLWLIALTAVLMPLAIAASWNSIDRRQTEYYAWMLVLQFAMLGVFAARDLLLFYVFFELTLIPMFFIIGIWGGSERHYAAAKFFLMTFSASVLTLAVVIYLGMHAGANGGPSFAIDAVVNHARALSPDARYWVFLALLAGFAVKVPLFPVHTWLPLAHTEAPTAGSVILAGVLLKLGTYGLMRFAIPIGMGDVTYELARFLGVLCLIGIVYGALAAWVQKDIKKLVAYSSVSHLGFCVLGLVALNSIGFQGSVLYMINHGLSTGAMFLVVGMIYERYHTRDIEQLSGLARRLPKLAFFFILFTLSSIGLPGLNGFASEFLTILGAFTSPYLGITYGVIASLGIILGAVYMLHMAACVIWGPLKTPVDNGGHGHAAADAAHAPIRDLSGREIAVLAPIAVLVVLLGVMPNIVLKTIEAPVAKMLATPAVAMNQK